MERGKGFECSVFPVSTAAYATAQVAGLYSTRPAIASDAPDAAGLPSAVPSFLEACALLAARAAAEGDLLRTRELIEKAARVTEMCQREPG